MTLLPRAIRNLLARKAPAPDCLAHLLDVPPYIPWDRDETADLGHDTHIAKLVQMRRDMEMK
jgi:hypothetical protein